MRVAREGRSVKNPACPHTIVQALPLPEERSMTTQSQCQENSGDHGALWAKYFQGLGEITSLGLKIEKKNTNQRLSALRMEYQAVQSPLKPFWWRIFPSFNSLE